MLKSLRCLTIALTDIPTEYKITWGYLTYHSGKLFNQALYLIKSSSAMPLYRGIGRGRGEVNPPVVVRHL